MLAQIGEMQVSESVFIEGDFFALIIFSILLPIGIYIYMIWKKSISRTTVLLLGIILIAISGIDVFLLQRLTAMAKTTPSLVDDIFFASESSVALYLLPLLFAGIGVNLISHILISHLGDAERRFDREHR
jgi:glycopeptide antibiotics resistance protein